MRCRSFRRSGSARRRRAPGAVDDVHHTLDDLVPETARLRRAGVPRARRDRRHPPGRRVHHRPGHPRLHALPPRGHGRRRGRELNGGGEPVALADPRVDGLPQIPVLAPAGLLPLGRRHEARELPSHVDAGRLAEPKPRHELVHTVDPEGERHLVEVDVAGPHDRQIQVDPAVPSPLPVPEDVAHPRQGEGATAVGGSGRQPDVVEEARQRHEGLHRRPRRVLPAQGPVVEGPLPGALQGPVARRVDPVDERIGVEARPAHEGPDRAGVGLDGHHRPVLLPQGLLGRELQGHVHVQVHVLARNRRAVREHPQEAPRRVGLDLLVAHPPVQGLLVRLLHPGLADVGGAGVIGTVQRLQLLLVDSPHVAHHVRRRDPEGIVPGEAGLHVDAGEAVAVHGEPGHLLLAQVEAQRHALEAPPALEERAEAGELPGPDLDHLPEVRERALHVRHRLRGHLDAEGQLVVGQQHAVPVVDLSARRRHRHQLDPVVLGQRGEVVVADDLEIVQPPDQGPDQQEHADEGEHEPVRHQQGFLHPVPHSAVQTHGSGRPEPRRPDSGGARRAGRRTARARGACWSPPGPRSPAPRSACPGSR